MPTQTPLTDEINALTQYANTITGASDTCLSDAVATLADGYGGGGSGSVVPVPTGKPLTDQINALTAFANTVTGLQDTCLSDAVESLIAGYGGNEWDYEWNYTDGLPENNGMTKTINGSPTIQMDEDGLYVRSAGTSYVRYDFATPTMTNGMGVVEVVAVIACEEGLNGYNLRLMASNGVDGGSILTPNLKICHMTGTSPSGATQIGTYTKNLETTFTVIMNGSTFDVYANGALVASGLNCSASKYCTNNRVFVQQTGVGYVKLKAIRAKYNRID